MRGLKQSESEFVKRNWYLYHKFYNFVFSLQVFNSGNAEMMVNISTNQPVFHVRGLSSGTEYRVKIYSVNDSGGVSEHAVFQTFTLQVNNQNYQYQLTLALRF